MTITAVDDLLKLVAGKDFKVFTSETDCTAPLTKQGEKQLQRLKNILIGVLEWQEYGGKPFISMDRAEIENYIDEIYHVIERGY